MSDHEYSDNCCCGECEAAWREVLLEAIDKGESKKKEKDEKG